MPHRHYISPADLRILGQKTNIIRNGIVYDYPDGLSLDYLGYIVVPSHTTRYREMHRNAQGDY